MGITHTTSPRLTAIKRFTIITLVGWTLLEALVLAIVSIGSRRTTTYA